MGQSRPLFLFIFRSFLVTISIIQIEKSVDSNPGPRDGADETTELKIIFLALFLVRLPNCSSVMPHENLFMENLPIRQLSFWNEEAEQDIWGYPLVLQVWFLCLEPKGWFKIPWQEVHRLQSVQVGAVELIFLSNDHISIYNCVQRCQVLQMLERWLSRVNVTHMYNYTIGKCQYL